MHELCLVAAEPMSVDAFGSFCVFFFAYISLGCFFLYTMVKDAIDDRKWKVQETLRGANRLLTDDNEREFQAAY
jgi:hypothetical protein